MTIHYSSHAIGCLFGLAIGDAMGMPTQSLSRSLILSRYGAMIERFEPAPPNHPIAGGLPAGRVTDDTEQAVLLGELMVESDGLPDPMKFADRLIRWEQSMRQRGSQDLLGPSTSRAIAELLSGTNINETGRYGTTNGAAMRIAPVGIATTADNLSELIESVEHVSRLSHNTGPALAGAAAIAAAISAGIQGATLEEATNLAVEAAHIAQHHGHWVAGGEIATRIPWAISTVSDSRTTSDAADVIYRLVGTSLASQESIPAVFAVLSIYPDDPWKACRLGASLGGDCDTIAALVGAVGGAVYGKVAFPVSACNTVAQVNHLDLDSLGTSLFNLRKRSTQYPTARDTWI